MAKPIGPRCNLACAYCYYLEKEDLYPEARVFRMADAMLERLIGDTMASQRTPEIRFAWQGGEPTLLGLDFFRRVVALQDRLCPAGRTVRSMAQVEGGKAVANSSGLSERPSRTSLRGVTTLYQGSTPSTRRFELYPARLGDSFGGIENFQRD